ncbi:MAG: hydantoin utilization protein, partial [Dehalococcoidia bacterium]|nr:hydantoin utilization protein [Dehalococcoidia bacterium]
PEVPVSLSHIVAPIWREYERGSTTVADAYIKPSVAAFAGSLDRGLRDRGLEATWALMKSNGGTMLPEAAPQQAVQLLLSGLAGGIIAGRYFGELVGSDKVITFDMGGTSTDVGLVIDGEYGYTTEYQVEWGMPVAAPFIDITTIGAGGGSLTWTDKGGFLKVGPQSAGADPGPACYDAGGTVATVTDANLVLGRLNPDYFLAGEMALNREKAFKAVASIGQQVDMAMEDAALAIVQLANENMANAIRLITVERGIDPRDFDLVAFGGAGPLQAVALAQAVGLQRVIVPPNAGLTSALGTLLADLRVDRSWTHAYRSNDLDVARINERFDALAASALRDLRSEGFAGTPTIARSISMRYLGQNYEQDVPVPPGPIVDETIAEVMERFHQQHEAFYGYSIAGEIMELIHFNVSAVGATPNVTLPRLPSQSAGNVAARSHREVYFPESGRIDCPIYRREDLFAGASLQGPAIIEDADSTTLLPERRRLSVTDHGSLIIAL